MIAIEVARAPQDFDCETCAHRHCDADGARPGSRGPAAFVKWEIRGVLKSRTCLLPMVTPLSRELLRLYGHYKNGLLPYAGGLYQQPRAFLTAMQVIERHALAS